MVLYWIDILPGTSNIITHISFANVFSIQYSQIYFFQSFCFLVPHSCSCCVCTSAAYAKRYMRFQWNFPLRIWVCENATRETNKRNATDRFTNSIETSTSDFLRKKKLHFVVSAMQNIPIVDYQQQNRNNKFCVMTFSIILFQVIVFKNVILLFHRNRNNNSFIRIKLNVYLLWNPIQIRKSIYWKGKMC